MKTVLICHDGATLDCVGLGRWLASFSELVGIVILRETKKQLWRIPAIATPVMHPGVCPEYRNARGCFWALANRTGLGIAGSLDDTELYGACQLLWQLILP